MRLRFFNILPALLLLSSPVNADEAFVLKGIYDFTLSNIIIGRMGLEIDQTPDHYSVTGDIATTGLLKLFVQHSSHTTADGEGKDHVYPNIKYESHYQTRKKKKYVAMRYEGGNVVEENLIPPDNRATRPAVATELKKDSADPLSLIIKIRENLIQALKQNVHSFTLNGYDGRRLTKIDFTVIGKKTLTYKGQPTPVILVDVKRTLVAGFTQSELDDIHAPEPPLHIYFKDDGTLKPLRLEATTWMGTLAATLTKECLPTESCLLGIKE